MAEKNPFAKFLTHYAAGHVLFQEGDEGEEMFIIQAGKVAIKKKVKDGADTTLAVLEKGDFFGEMALLERQPRSAAAECLEESDLIVINGETLGDMIKSNPEIAVRMLRKQSIRLRETNRQLQSLLGSGELAPAEARPAPGGTGSTLQAEAKAYFISVSTGNVFPVFSNEALIGRYDSVTGLSPEVDLTKEDQSRNISRRHARIVIKEGKFYVAEEIGTMNGTYLNGQKMPNGVLTPIKDGDELVLCRLALQFKSAR